MAQWGTLSAIEAAWTLIGLIALTVQALLLLFAHGMLHETLAAPEATADERLLAHSIYEDEALLVVVAIAIVAIGVAAGLTPAPVGGPVTKGALVAFLCFFAIDGALLLRGVRRYLVRQQIARTIRARRGGG